MKHLFNYNYWKLYENKDYKSFYQELLKKMKVSSPSELSKEDRKKFYSELNKKWKNKTD
jgi:uncharacterized protein YaiI (UPF0178 family)